MSGLLEVPKVEIGGSTVDGVTSVSLEFLTTFGDDDSPGKRSGYFEDDCSPTVTSGVVIVEGSEDELVPLFLLTLSLCC